MKQHAGSVGSGQDHSRTVKSSAQIPLMGSCSKERVKKHIYQTRDLAVSNVADYIDAFYSLTRRHSHLGG